MAVKLHYPKGRGIAEVIRIALGAAEIEFEEQFIMNKEDFANLRTGGKALFNQIPILEIDGLHLCQSMSILRYICRKQGWLGKNPEELVRIEMLSEGARDAYKIIMSGHIAKLDKDNPKEWDDAIAKVKERYLPVFEKELESTGSGYLIGSSLTMCDLVLLDCITWIAEKETEVLEQYPNILNFLITMTSHPGIQKYLDGPQRNPMPDKNLMEVVRAALS